MFTPVTARAAGMSEPPRVAGLSPGLVVAGRYRLIRYLACGGMAEVWLAEHEDLRSQVAIKFVHARITADPTVGPLALDRFRLEAQVSAKLAALTQHVVAVHDAGLHEGVPYLVMEYVVGRTLEEEVEASGPILPERLAGILDQVADALDAAHAVGIIHRDIKPSNVMLKEQPDGSTLVKVADFGIAKAIHRNLPVDRPRETAVGEIVGSPAYMSPEQIRGSREIDARTDIWSLGVVVYEALTGRACFGGATIADLMVTVIGRDFEPATRARAGLPRTLDAWFDGALALQPDQRFATAREAAVAFRAALAAAPRRRIGMIALAALALVVVAIFAVALAGRHATPVAATTPPSALTSAPPPPAAVSAASIATAPVSVPVSVMTAPPTSGARPARSTQARPILPAPAPTTAITAAPAPPPPPPEPPKVEAPPPPKKKIDPSEIQ